MCSTSHVHLRPALICFLWTLGALPLVFPSVARAAGYERTFGGPDADHAYSVRQTTDGGFIIAGSTGVPGNHDVYLIKTDPFGNESWSRTFGGPGMDVASSVQETTDGGYIVAGGTAPVAGPSAAWLIKTDAAGNEVWNVVFDDRDNYAFSVQQTTDGGYILAGDTMPVGGSTSEADVLLIKTDAAGNQVWRRTFGGASSDNAYCVRQTPDGGYILAASTMSFGAGGSDAWLIKTDTAGNMTWSQTFGGAQPDFAYSVTPTSDGGYALAGHTWSFGAEFYDAWLIKTDAVGSQLWHQLYGGLSGDGAESVQEIAGGGYILGGSTRSFGRGKNDNFLLIKTDASGNQLWLKAFGGDGYEHGFDVQQTVDGGFVVVGDTEPFGGAVEPDAYLVYDDGSDPMPPVVDVKANGSDGPLIVSFGTPVTFSISLDAGDSSGLRIDDWLGLKTPWGTYWLDPISYPNIWTLSPIPIYWHSDYELQDISPTSGSATVLPIGFYVCFFVVDDNPDGTLDALTWYDFVVVAVVP